MKIYAFTNDRTNDPLAFHAGALDHLATLIVDELWFKLLHYLGNWIKSTHVAIHVSNLVWFGVYWNLLSGKIFFTNVDVDYHSLQSMA